MKFCTSACLSTINIIATPVYAQKNPQSINTNWNGCLAIVNIFWLILHNKFENGFLLLKNLKIDFLLLLNMAFVWTEWVEVTTKNLKQVPASNF